MDYKIKNRHRLKSKDIRKFLSELQDVFSGNFFDERSSVETGNLGDYEIVLVDGEPCFVYYNGKIIFTLHGVNKFKPRERFVVVDMGAVRFVTSGAAVMAPGIIDADKDIVKNDQVWICDETHHKPLAVGIAIMSGEQMINEKKGKAVTVIHYVGDPLWNFSAKSL
jgi:PUA domain protein